MADAGSLLLQGAQNFGSGIEQYRQIQAADSAASGQINAFLAQGPQAIAMLSHDGQSLIEKQMSGKANYKDRLQLMGEISTSLSLRKQQQELAIQNIQLQKWRYMQNMLAQADQQNSAPQQMPQMQQGQPPQGSSDLLNGPLVNNQIRPPVPVTVASPEVQQLLPRLFASTMGDPDKMASLAESAAKSINDNRQSQYNQAVAVKKNTGRLVYVGPKYENGVATFDQYKPEIVSAPGTPVQGFDTGSEIVSFKHGVKPTMPVVFKPGEGTPTGPEDAQSKIAAASPFNQNDPEIQKSVANAKQDLSALGGTVGEAELLAQAAQAYAQGGPSNLNALRGNPEFAKISSVFSGKNPQAALQAALSANTRSILNQIQNSQNGTIGGRILQAEFENTAKLLSEPEADNATILSAARNNEILLHRLYDLKNANANYLGQMPAGEAADLANKQFGGVPKLVSAGKIQNIPKEAITKLKILMAQKHPEAVDSFKKHFGVSDDEANIALLAR